MATFWDIKTSRHVLEIMADYFNAKRIPVDTEQSPNSPVRTLRSQIEQRPMEFLSLTSCVLDICDRIEIDSRIQTDGRIVYVEWTAISLKFKYTWFGVMLVGA